MNAIAVVLAGTQDNIETYDTQQGEGAPNCSSLRLSADLPLPLTTTIGREQEREAICTLLQRPEVRLLPLTGTGGVGKTRLAVEVARAMRPIFADGVCFVALAPLSDPEMSRHLANISAGQAISSPLGRLILPDTGVSPGHARGRSRSSGHKHESHGFHPGCADSFYPCRSLFTHEGASR